MHKCFLIVKPSSILGGGGSSLYKSEQRKLEHLLTSIQFKTCCICLSGHFYIHATHFGLNFWYEKCSLVCMQVVKCLNFRLQWNIHMYCRIIVLFVSRIPDPVIQTYHPTISYHIMSLLYTKYFGENVCSLSQINFIGTGHILMGRGELGKVKQSEELWPFH